MILHRSIDPDTGDGSVLSHLVGFTHGDNTPCTAEILSGHADRDWEEMLAETRPFIFGWKEERLAW